MLEVPTALISFMAQKNVESVSPNFLLSILLRFSDDPDQQADWTLSGILATT